MASSETFPGALIVGAGPAGLRAAEVLADAGHPVRLAEAGPFGGRKLLIAGRGGLNVTHSEPFEDFVRRFTGGSPGRWRDLLEAFGPAELREWMAGLGVETYVGTSGRVFPAGERASKLLRSWHGRLRELGVEFLPRHRFRAFSGPRACLFGTEEGERRIEAAATVLAMGGGSWPRTGSDGQWVGSFREAGFEVSPLEPSNCGHEVDWEADFLAKAEGLPLKNLAVRLGERVVRGELLVTRYGLEGGALYQLSGALRGRHPVTIEVDLKPDVPVERLVERLARFRGKGTLTRKAGVAWKLGKAGRALLARTPSDEAEELARRVKALPVRLERPRPLAEAISSAGGVSFADLGPDLQVLQRPGTFLAGEMLDWDAPTGGYLLTGCLATGTRAGEGAAAFLEAGQSSSSSASKPM